MPDSKRAEKTGTRGGGDKFCINGSVRIPDILWRAQDGDKLTDMDSVRDGSHGARL